MILRKFLRLYTEIFKRDIIGWGVLVLGCVLIHFCFDYFVFSGHEQDYKKGFLGILLLLFGCIYALLIRPWSKIFNYIKNLPISKTERIFFVVASNLSSLIFGSVLIAVITYFYGILSILNFVVDTYANGSILFISYFVIGVAVSFLPYDPSRGKALGIFNRSKYYLAAIGSFIFIRFTFSPYHFEFALLTLCLTVFIISSLYELRILLNSFMVIVAFVFALSGASIMAPKLSIADISDHSNYEFILNIKKLDEEDTSLAIETYLASNLSSFDYGKICEEYFPSKSRRQKFSYPFTSRNCLMPMFEFEKFKLVLNTKKDFDSLARAFASFDLGAFEEEHFEALLVNLEHRVQSFSIDTNSFVWKWTQLVDYISGRDWKTEELKKLLKSDHAGVRLLSFSIFLHNELGYLIDEDDLMLVKEIEKNSLYSVILKNLLSSYLYIDSFSYKKSDLLHALDECTILKKMSSIAFERMFYLGNDYFQLQKTIKR